MRKTTVYESHGEEDTFALGLKLGSDARPGQVYCLNGDLGVGKTVFTKGFAKGLGIDEVISSPTFTIKKSYEEGRIPLCHFDVYRIEDEDEMEEIGYEDEFYGDGVSLVEWAENIRGILPEDAVEVTIEKDLEKGFDYRRITVIS
ncbi:MAG: tRNA (adenosine(37)-N6)-threonylcarbamoyltransferase complex ATPase subunit type 1 TsaE [Clostridium sp.]|nr:tRNA (adenosine(37)-N6)-threonylcarbamoyltransferase complex ATPase subunit type 1 TsaE [Clostridium sp.]